MGKLNVYELLQYCLWNNPWLCYRFVSTILIQPSPLHPQYIRNSLLPLSSISQSPAHSLPLDLLCAQFKTVLMLQFLYVFKSLHGICLSLTLNFHPFLYSWDDCTLQFWSLDSLWIYLLHICQPCKPAMVKPLESFLKLPLPSVFPFYT